MPTLSAAERSLSVRRQAARLCRAHGWSVLHEVSLPNGRRADLLALTQTCDFVCIEVKSGMPDFLADRKWREYLEFCDRFYFAIDDSIPAACIPADVGLIIASDADAAVVRDPDTVPLPAARRRSLLARFAQLAAGRLEQLLDPLPGQALLVE